MPSDEQQGSILNLGEEIPQIENEEIPRWETLHIPENYKVDFKTLKFEDDEGSKIGSAKATYLHKDKDGKTIEEIPLVIKRKEYQANMQSNDRNYLKYFIREKVINEFQCHRNLINLFHYWTDPEKKYSYMAFNAAPEGSMEDLKQDPWKYRKALIDKENEKDVRLNETTFAKYAYQLIDVVHYLHKNKIMHRGLEITGVSLDRANEEIKINSLEKARVFSYESSSEALKSVATDDTEESDKASAEIMTMATDFKKGDPSCDMLVMQLSAEYEYKYEEQKSPNGMWKDFKTNTTYNEKIDIYDIGMILCHIILKGDILDYVKRNMLVNLVTNNKHYHTLENGDIVPPARPGKTPQKRYIKTGYTGKNGQPLFDLKLDHMQKIYPIMLLCGSNEFFKELHENLGIAEPNFKQEYTKFFKRSDQTDLPPSCKKIGSKNLPEKSGEHNFFKALMNMKLKDKQMAGKFPIKDENIPLLVDLLNSMIRAEPKDRKSAEELLKHEFFSSEGVNILEEVEGAHRKYLKKAKDEYKFIKLEKSDDEKKVLTLTTKDLEDAGDVIIAQTGGFSLMKKMNNRLPNDLFLGIYAEEESDKKRKDEEQAWKVKHESTYYKFGKNSMWMGKEPLTKSMLEMMKDKNELEKQEIYDTDKQLHDFNRAVIASKITIQSFTEADLSGTYSAFIRDKMDNTEGVVVGEDSVGNYSTRGISDTTNTTQNNTGRDVPLRGPIVEIEDDGTSGTTRNAMNRDQRTWKQS